MKARRSSHALAVAVAAVVMAGCATFVELPNVSGETLSGRIAVRVDASGATPARSLNAAFELQGNPTAGRLDLSTPLGSVLARARWSLDRVVLATPQGETAFADLDSLTREVVGESIPIAALFDWLHGRPWSGADSRPRTSADERGFEQLGWTVNLAQFDEATISARRERAPAVTIRAKLDR